MINNYLFLIPIDMWSVYAESLFYTLIFLTIISFVSLSDLFDYFDK
jgi:hypothetical protein